MKSQPALTGFVSSGMHSAWLAADRTNIDAARRSIERYALMLAPVTVRVMAGYDTGQKNSVAERVVEHQ